jgi:hypothetical protein
MKLNINFNLEATMTDSRTCLPRRLVERSPFFIDACACGTLHVSAGSVTLRLKRAAARELAAALFEALADEEDREVPALC